MAALGKLLDEVFDLLASGVFEGFGTAEVDGVGFHQFGIELVLADDLAEPVADLVTGTIAVPIPVGIFEDGNLLQSEPEFVPISSTEQIPMPYALRRARLTARVSAMRISAPRTSGETLEGSASP